VIINNKSTRIGLLIMKIGFLIFGVFSLYLVFFQENKESAIAGAGALIVLTVTFLLIAFNENKRRKRNEWFSREEKCAPFFLFRKNLKLNLISIFILQLPPNKNHFYFRIFF